MVEREARANRFVSQLAEVTERLKPSENSSRERLLQLARLRVLHLRNLLDSAEVELDKLLQ
jgi:hypothetical protein